MLHINTIEGQLDAKGLSFTIIAARFNDIKLFVNPQAGAKRSRQWP